MLSPLLVIGWEWLWTGGLPRVQPWGAPFLAWGYLQYKLIGIYRIGRGGGGPGMRTLPERLVATGPYAWSRNPMYLGHIVFLIGLAVTFRSFFAAALTAATVVWFHRRVRRDETRLRAHFGQPYADYCTRVPRWIPGLF